MCIFYIFFIVFTFVSIFLSLNVPCYTAYLLVMFSYKSMRSVHKCELRFFNINWPAGGN